MKRRKATRKKTPTKTPRWYAPVAILFVVGVTLLLPVGLRDLGKRIPFKVRQLQVDGANAISSLDLKSMAGVHEGKTLFGNWAKDAVEKMKQHPRVERVTVAKDATGKVFVRVLEREPVALVNLDRLYFIDREGDLLGPANLESPGASDLVVFTGPWRRVPAEGLKEELQTGLLLRDTLVGVGFKEENISELHFDTSLGWIFYRANPAVRVIIGKGPFPVKVKRLAHVLRDFDGKEEVVKEIDLSFRDRAIVKMKTAG